MNDQQPGEPTRQEQEDYLVQVCDALGLDRDLLDVDLVLKLTKQVAHRFVRPMAPVTSYALGIAVGAAAAAGAKPDQHDLAARVTALLPTESA